MAGYKLLAPFLALLNKSDFWPQSGSDQHIHDDLLPVD